MWWSVLVFASAAGQAASEACPDCGKPGALTRAAWVTGPWGPCTVEGQQQRPVWCLDSSRAIASREACMSLAETAPIETQPCPVTVSQDGAPYGVVLPLEVRSSSGGVDQELAEALAGIRDFEKRLEIFGHHDEREGANTLLPPVPVPVPVRTVPAPAETEPSSPCATADAAHEELTPKEATPPPTLPLTPSPTPLPTPPPSSPPTGAPTESPTPPPTA